ncbi:hypothetical protein EON79_05855 [bacterium]|nr:MAG: hypothetical protein EON79_05855 [bacterium]
MNHSQIGTRVFAALALATAFASAPAQAPTFSRITMDPTITTPTGDLFCVDIARVTGYSLVLSNAGNLSRDSGVGSQYYFVSPDGAAERIPLEKVGALARTVGRPGLLQEGLSRISPRGSGAIVRTSDNLHYYYQREGKQFTKLEGFSRVIGFTSETKALVTRDAGSDFSGTTNLSGWQEVFEVDTATGRLTPYALPFTPAGVSERRLVADRWLYYTDTENRQHFFDVVTKKDTTLAATGLTFNQTLDQTGTWVYTVEHEGTEGVLKRMDIRTGVTTTIQRIPRGSSLYPDSAYGDKIAFVTSDDLDPSETTFGFDVYEFNVATNTLSLLSRKADGKPSDNATPYFGLTYYTPDGGQLVYQTAFGLYQQGNYTPRPGEWGFTFRQSVRQSVGGTPQAIATTVGGGGANARNSITSRNSTSVLYGAANPGIEGWARLVVRDSAARSDGRIVSDSDPYAHTPCDVSDDGRFAVYLGYSETGGTDQGYHLFVYDSQTSTRRRVTDAFTNGIGSRARGKVDQEGHMWFIADTTGKYAGLSGNWLFRCDMATGALTPVREVGAVPTVAVYAVGGGRVAYPVGTTGAPFVAVTDGFTGQERFRVPSVSNVVPGWTVLTTDRKTLALAGSTGTTLYDIPAGTVRQTFSVAGKLTPSGYWVVNNDEAVYVATGAVLSHSPRTAALGAPVGPAVVYGELSGPFESNPTTAPPNDRGADFVRYRVPVATSPVLYGTGVTVNRARLRINAFVLPAGLETAETWVEARLNGGAWERLTFSSSGLVTVPSPDGPTTVELRGRDALGRTTEIETFAVDGDTVIPIVSDVAVRVAGTTATIRFSANEEGTSRVRYGIDNLSLERKILRQSQGAREIVLTNLQANKTYRLIVDISDRAGNVGQSQEMTFTTGA